MSNKYITVKELAEINGISKVTVTNRLNKEGIQPHHIDNTTKTKYYDSTKLPQSLCADSTNIGANIGTNEVQTPQNGYKGGTNTEKEIISILREQLAVKDRQIEELNNRLADVTRLVSQQQYLTAKQPKGIARLFQHKKNKDDVTGQI